MWSYMSFVKGIEFQSCRLLVLLILNGTAKTKLRILAFLYCEKMVKNSNALCYAPKFQAILFAPEANWMTTYVILESLK